MVEAATLPRDPGAITHLVQQVIGRDAGRAVAACEGARVVLGVTRRHRMQHHRRLEVGQHARLDMWRRCIGDA